LGPSGDLPPFLQYYYYFWSRVACPWVIHLVFDEMKGVASC
jgi:hypothetical protein